MQIVPTQTHGRAQNNRPPTVVKPQQSPPKKELGAPLNWKKRESKERKNFAQEKEEKGNQRLKIRGKDPLTRGLKKKAWCPKGKFPKPFSPRIRL